MQLLFPLSLLEAGKVVIQGCPLNNKLRVIIWMGDGQSFYLTNSFPGLVMDNLV